jgi:hypothetical protein
MHERTDRRRIRPLVEHAVGGDNIRGRRLGSYLL